MKIKEKIDELVFKEYDIRGIYPSQIDEDLAYTIGLSFGSIIQEKYDFASCVIGRDNRLSSPSLHEALIEGIKESGVDVLDLGLCTTGMLYTARFKLRKPGIMVTASHNPKDDNGFKFSFDSMCNARGEMITDFKEFTLAKKFKKGQGSYKKYDFTDDYFDEMHKTLKMGNRKLKVAIDPANGVACEFVHKAHDIYDFDFIYINDKSDGNFPKHHPDPNVPENLTELAELVVRQNCDIGLSYDGDADRIGIIDEKGNWISPDYLMIVIIRDIFDKCLNKTFSFDVKCTKSLADEIIMLGGTPDMYRAGASYAQAKVIDDALDFGGEYSGHLYFQDRRYPDTCGIYSGLRFLEILSNTNKSFSELFEGVTIYKNIPEMRIDCAEEKKEFVIAAIKEHCDNNYYEYNDIDGIRVEFIDGWALIRPSNTGPKITTRFEATTDERLEKIQNEFMNILQKELN